jgi:hypothetical protein
MGGKIGQNWRPPGIAASGARRALGSAADTDTDTDIGRSAAPRTPHKADRKTSFVSYHTHSEQLV